MIYGISDLHLNHKKIILYENRPFTDVKHMNRVLIDNWNSIVKENDYVINVGDFCLGSTQDYIDLRQQLNGKIILIKGNHDRQTRRVIVERAGFIAFKKIIELNHVCLKIVHNPAHIKEDGFIILHGHIHSKTVHHNFDNKYINLSVDVTDFKPVCLYDILALNQYRALEEYLEEINDQK